MKHALRILLDLAILPLVLQLALSVVLLGLIGLGLTTGNPRLLEFGEGIGVLLALGPLTILVFFSTLIVPALGLGLVVRQIWQRDLPWVTAFAAAAVAMFSVSSIPLMILEIAYYILVLRPQLGGEVPQIVAKKWHKLFIALPVLFVAWVIITRLLPGDGGSRRFVVEPAPDARAPFSLVTHRIDIADGFDTTEPDGRGGRFMETDALAFSPDGTRAAFKRVVNGKKYIVTDGNALAVPEFVSLSGFKYSEDSEWLSFVQFDGTNKIMAIPRNQRSLLEVGLLTDADAYPCDAWKEGGVACRSDSFGFDAASNDSGARAQVVMTKGGCGTGPFSCSFIVRRSINGKTEFESRSFVGKDEPTNLALSPDGKMVAYVVGPVSLRGERFMGRSVVLIDNQPGRAFDLIADGSLRFSPDGRYLAYGAQLENELWWIVEEVVPDRDNMTVSSLFSIKKHDASAESLTSSASSTVIDTFPSSRAIGISSASNVPVAPFDGCNRLDAYAKKPWFPALKEKMLALGFFAGDVSEACLSADYLIFIRPLKADEASHVYRFSIADSSLERAGAQDSYAGLFHVERFGKRQDDFVPLRRQSCVTDVYNVRLNTYAPSDYLCRSGAGICSDPPVQREIGDSVYPSLSEYAHLTHLGPIFTAARCGPDRLRQVTGKERYTLGSSIGLHAEPTPGLRSVLESIGYECKAPGCTRWMLDTTVSVQDLLRLMPFVTEMAGDDCVQCG